MENSINPDKIAGFVVGEGCFYAEFGRDGTYKNKIRVRPNFVIELAIDDQQILEDIKIIIGCGSVYNLDFGRYKKYQDRKWKAHARYKVSNFTDIIEKVIPFFQKHTLFGNKQKAFNIFTKICDLLNMKEHLSSQGLKTIQTLVEELRMINKRGV